MDVKLRLVGAAVGGRGAWHWRQLRKLRVNERQSSSRSQSDADSHHVHTLVEAEHTGV